MTKKSPHMAGCEAAGKFQTPLQGVHGLKLNFGVMMVLHQNDLENIKDLLNLGKISVSEANVQMVLAGRIRLAGKIPRDIRAALNQAVKEGRLGHLKKDGQKPECYYHPTFEYMAIAERNRIERKNAMAVAKVCGGGIGDYFNEGL